MKAINIAGLPKPVLYAGCAIALTLASPMAAVHAFAQQQPAGQANGTTSGPAAGGNVEPSAATQKKAGTPDAGAVSAGAPGTAATKGSESGPKPKP
jgi:hypothetical protein